MNHSNFFDINYHNSIIDIIIDEKKRLEEMFDFNIDKIYKNQHINNIFFNYELDIYVKSNNLNEGIIEVKSHKKLRYKFVNNQLDIFRENHPNAKVYLAYSKIFPVKKFEDITFEYFKPLNDFSIEWI
jgi:hypothetical protein